MTKQDFLTCLKQGLTGIPQSELDGRLAFYSEIIDDRIEEGLTEEEAVADVGNVDEIITQVLSEIPLPKLIKEKVKPKSKMKTWEIVLLIIGAPIWLPLLISAVAVIFSLYVSLWAVIISLWAVAVSIIACSVGFTVYGIVSLVLSNKTVGLFFIGSAFVCAGLATFMFVGFKTMTKGTVHLTKEMILKIKILFIKKGDA